MRALATAAIESGAEAEGAVVEATLPATPPGAPLPMEPQRLEFWLPLEVPQLLRGMLRALRRDTAEPAPRVRGLRP